MNAATLEKALDRLMEEGSIEKHSTNIGGFIFRIPQDSPLIEETLDALYGACQAMGEFTVVSLHSEQVPQLRLSKRDVSKAVDIMERKGLIRVTGEGTHLGNTYKIYAA